MDQFFLTAVEKQAIRNLEVAENIQNLYEAMKIIFSETLITTTGAPLFFRIVANE